jgi:hypothetical protein
MNYAEALNQIADDLRYFRERQERLDNGPWSEAPPPPPRPFAMPDRIPPRRKWWKR